MVGLSKEAGHTDASKSVSELTAPFYICTPIPLHFKENVVLQSQSGAWTLIGEPPDCSGFNDHPDSLKAHVGRIAILCTEIKLCDNS